MTVEKFLQHSLTAYHAVQNAKALLDEAGFVDIDKRGLSDLKVGDKCYSIWGGTSLFAFRVGQEEQVTIAECHTDSPALRVKGRATLPSAEGYRLNVEKYGGLLLYSMLDIPLKVAGRVTVETEDGVKTKLVAGEENVVIPSMCIHHNRDANAALTLNVQSDMLPLLGDVKDVYQWIAPDEKVLDADLLVVPAVAPYSAGAKDEWLCAPRIDNLTSMYAAVEALIDADPAGLAVVACYDNEEIGSGTKRGAGSDYLATLLGKVWTALGRKDVENALSKGLALSVDNGHAVHPAHPEKSDPAGAPVMGGGVVIKHHVNYATDGLSAGIFKRILDKAHIARQDYYNHSDISCGSTLGNIAARSLLVDTVDIGIAQLAMHSAVEMAAKADVDTMRNAIAATFATTIRRKGDEVILG